MFGSAAASPDVSHSVFLLFNSRKLLHTKAYQSAWKWDPPFKSPKAVVILFFIANIFLIAVPLIPPAPGSKTYERLPYWVSNVKCLATITLLTSRFSLYLVTFPCCIYGITRGDYVLVFLGYLVAQEEGVQTQASLYATGGRRFSLGFPERFRGFVAWL